MSQLSVEFDGGDAKPSERLLALSRKLVGGEESRPKRMDRASARTRDVIPLHEAAPNIPRKDHSRRPRGPLPKRSPSIAATGNVNGPRVCF
jgi:hypothetical protein